MRISDWSSDVCSSDLSQPFHVAEVFTGIPGKFVQIEDTIKSFKAVVDGEYDHLPEAAFYMVGGIDEAIEKAAKLAAEAARSEEHTSELQSLMRSSYAVFCLKKTKRKSEESRTK